MSPARSKHIIWFCGLVFIAAVIGSCYCGIKLSDESLSSERISYLRLLIYFHFALSQLSIIAALYTLYISRYREQRNCLIVSYNEQGIGLNPPGIKLRPHTTYRCYLGGMDQAKLPPADKVTVVYPMMMQSGFSSGEKLEAELYAAYAQRGEKPQLYIQPVLGASPMLVQLTVKRLNLVMHDGDSILVVAHGPVKGQEIAPEAALFCRRLNKIYPHVMIQLAYLGVGSPLLQQIEEMPSSRIILVPFLLVEGIHSQRDLPKSEQAAALGKTLSVLPVMGDMLR